MLDTKQFGEFLKNKGYDFYTGVPCSWMKDLINYAYNDCEYYNAGNEGDAIALAAGAHIAGRKTVVMMQNSGFGNAISPLTSLNYIFKIPSLVFISMRTGSILEPQHELMGDITDSLVDTIKMNYCNLSSDYESATAQITNAINVMNETNLPFFVLVSKDTFSKVSLNKKEPKLRRSPKGLPHFGATFTFPTRYEALQTITADNTDKIFIGTTGMTGRELYDISDNEHNLYMVGSMGCIGALGLGIALNTNKKVVIIDGDGAAIMRLSTIPLIAEYEPKNLLHILLNNRAHDTTGGQATLSNNIEWVDVVKSLGYSNAHLVNNLENLSIMIKHWDEHQGLKFIELKTSVGSKEGLGRPEVTPVDVKTRLMNYIKK